MLLHIKGLHLLKQALVGFVASTALMHCHHASVCVADIMAHDGPQLSSANLIHLPAEFATIMGCA